MKLLIAIITLAAAAAASAQNTLVINPSSGNFGGVEVGTTSPLMHFTVTNETISTMGYLGYTNLGEFKLQAGTCHLVNGEPMLNPGQSCAFTAVFLPTKVGTVNGNLSIKTSSGTFNVPMSGTGVYNNESTLYSFCHYAPCTDGAIPEGSLVQDAAGNLYGTTEYGGNNGSGTVFKLDTKGHQTVLYSFCSEAFCPDGSNPYAGLLLDHAGNLYGTTVYGGANNTSCGGGCGTVFKLDPTGHETVLYNFCSSANCIDGSNPQAGLIQDAAGNLYGTTVYGGTTYTGIVFKLDTSGHETVLHNFCYPGICPDGAYPLSTLIRDFAGNLYGTTGSGGAHNGGTVFKVDNTDHETVLYSFCSAANCTDGGGPVGGVIQDTAGILYGMTNFGGAKSNFCSFSSRGCGAVFKLDTAGHETVLYSFCPAANCADGGRPNGGLIQDTAGNLYGTAEFGGANGEGTVFKVDNMGHETTLYTFCSAVNCTDGALPNVGLIQDAAGNLYGATFSGFSGYGTVFKLTPPFN